MGTEHTESINGKVLIAYFSWGGNTAGIAEEIQVQTDADLFEITLVNPYSTDYNTVLDEAQRDQNEQVRLEPATHVENMDEQDNILPGSTNWWVSIPMPTASFLEEYDFSGKTVIPFCTSASSGLGESGSLLAEMAGTGNWLEGRRFSSGANESEITAWVETLQP